MTRSRAQWRAIFRALKMAGVTAGVGAGAYYGTKKLRQFTRRRKYQKELNRSKNVEALIFNKPDERVIDTLKSHYQGLGQDLTPASRKKYLEGLQFISKSYDEERKPKPLKTRLHELRRNRIFDAVYEEGKQQGVMEVQDTYDKKFRALQRTSSTLKEAQDLLTASGTSVPGTSEHTKKGLSRVADILLGTDPEAKIEKGRRWLEKQMQKFEQGEITNQQRLGAVIKFNRYKRKVIKDSKRENRYSERPSDKMMRDDRGQDATMLPSAQAQLKKERRQRRELGGN